MARKKIDDRTAEQFAYLHRKGESYQSIGQKFGVNYRTVKSRIQKVSEGREREHWEVVSQQVDAKYLDEHYRMLMKIAISVAEVVSSDPIVTSHTLAIPDFSNILMRSAMQKAAKLLVDRGLDLTAEGKIGDYEAHRLSRKLLKSLMEHEPLLEKAFEAWKREWETFQKLCLELTKAAENMFKNAKVDNAVAKDIKRGIVDEALRNKLLGEEPCSSRVDVSNKDDKRIRKQSTRDELVKLIRYNESVEVTVYIGSQQEVEAARMEYDKVLSKLCHEDLIHSLQVSYRLLNKHVKAVEDCVDHIILVGKPHGQCWLCLNQSTQLPSPNRKVHPKEQ